jgi:apolipoprotein D and lipocalin family protein
MQMIEVVRRARLAVCVVLLAGCATAPNPNPRAADELQLPAIDLARYMGRWYNISNVPYFGERGYVASYSEWHLQPDGSIQDLYIGRKGGFDVPETRREFVDSVVPGSGGAEWRVRVFWPIYVSQLTLYVDPQYQYTILATRDKKLGWIFARAPDISEASYRELLARLDSFGFDTSRFRRVPQHPDQLGRPGFQSPGDPD